MHFIVICGLKHNKTIHLHNAYAPINVKPVGRGGTRGGGGGQHTGISLWRISPEWGFWPDIMHLICQFQRVDEN